jgi:hypothetical protein
MTSGGDPRVPRSSGQVVRSSLEDLRSRRKRRALRRTILGLGLLVGLVWGANRLLVDRPVQAALASDRRTAAIGMVGHLDRYVIPTTLVLDLRRVAVTDTVDLLRGVLVVGRDLAAYKMLDRVVLARAGTPVYVLSGDDFRKLGHDFTVVRNMVVVLRSLSEALRLPGGQKPPALDFGEAAYRWASGGQ